jgi:hypothetical protein
VLRRNFKLGLPITERADFNYWLIILLISFSILALLVGMFRWWTIPQWRCFFGCAGIILEEIDLQEKTLIAVYMPGANLAKANLAGAALWEVNLTGANLRQANLGGVDLRSVTLTGADLTGAVLTQTNRAGANLQAVTLINADLSGADLSGADLSKATKVCVASI